MCISIVSGEESDGSDGGFVTQTPKEVSYMTENNEIVDVPISAVQG